MNDLFSRFGGAQHDPAAPGVPLQWNVHPDGLPIRSGDAPPMIERARLEHATHKFYPGSEVLKIPEQVEKYLEIIGRIANGLAVLDKREIREDPTDSTKWIVWITWYELRGLVPQGNNLLR